MERHYDNQSWRRARRYGSDLKTQVLKGFNDPNVSELEGGRKFNNEFPFILGKSYLIDRELGGGYGSYSWIASTALSMATRRLRIVEGIELDAECTRIVYWVGSSGEGFKLQPDINTTNVRAEIDFFARRF